MTELKVEMEQKMKRYYNTTDSPVVVDSEGRTLGGREHGDYEPTPELTHGVDYGFLIDQGEVEENRHEQHEDGNKAEPSTKEGDSTPRSHKSKATDSNTNKEK